MSTSKVKYKVWCHHAKCAYYDNNRKSWHAYIEEKHVKDDYKQHMLDYHTTNGDKYVCNWKIGESFQAWIPCDKEFDLDKDFEALWKHMVEDHYEDGAMEKFVEAAPNLWAYAWKWEELERKKPNGT